MSPSGDELTAARNRIRVAYSPELLGQLGRQLADQLTRQLEQVESSRAKVLNWKEPAENIREAAAELGRAREPSPNAAMAEEFGRLVSLMLDHGHNLHDPRYIGHQVPASVPIAGLFDAVGSVTNQVMAVYEMGPWATAVERALIDEVGRTVGFTPGEFSGLVTHGGSLANLTGLLTARNVSLAGVWEKGLTRCPVSPVVVVHGDAHYSVARAAGILGLGADGVIKAELDERRRMDPAKLDQVLSRLRAEGRLIVAVVACACATPIGAFDPVDAIADVCEKHSVWLHVDAAHGGAACFSERHAHLVHGLQRADSVVLDAHKMLFAPALCAFVFYRQKANQFEAFRQSAPYLFDPTDPGLAEFDSGMKTVECTKRAAAFGLWGIWSLFGRELFGDLVDVTFATAGELYRLLCEADDFVPLHVPQCNIVTFRYLPVELRDSSPDRIGLLQRSIRQSLIRSGEFYIVQTELEGQAALRVSVMNPLTERGHLMQLLQAIRETGQRLLSQTS